LLSKFDRATLGEAMGRGRHKMSSVGRMTGFSPALLRAWESRHRLLAPERGAGGQRLYTDDDVRVLRAVRELLDQGRAIGEIATLGRKALLALAEAPKTAPAPGDPSGSALVEAMVKQVRLELTLGWTLDGGNAAAAVRSMHAASVAVSRLAARLDLKQLVDVVVETLDADFDAALARIWIYEPHENALYLRASAGLSRRTTTSSRARIDLAQYPYKVGVVARSREPFVSNGLLGDPHFEQPWVKRESLTSVAIVPLVSDGVLQGVLASFFRQRLSEEVVGALGTFAAMTASAIATRRRPRRSKEDSGGPLVRHTQSAL
jgi:DNA-binding transcriptional MerR regulator